MTVRNHIYGQYIGDDPTVMWWKHEIMWLYLRRKYISYFVFHISMSSMYAPQEGVKVKSGVSKTMIELQVKLFRLQWYNIQYIFTQHQF